MAVQAFDPALQSTKRRAALSPRAAPPRAWVSQVAVAVVAVGFVLAMLSAILVETGRELSLPGGVATFAGTLTGMAGTYLLLVMLLLVSRIGPVERVLGQDGLLRWHRRVAPWPISLLVAHALLIIVGYAQAGRTGFLHESVTLILHFPDVLAATVGLGLMVAAGIVSIRAVRNRLQRETWWSIHLYMYLAIALSFAHAVALGPSFVGHPLTRVLWAIVWAATAGVVLVYRFGVPLLRNARYGLRVAEVRSEGPDVVSVICTGRGVQRLAVSGGQFFTWRFLTPGLWWQAHPFSLSARPRPPYIRLTVKQVGDFSRGVARLRPGTRVLVEGPFGAFTADSMRQRKALLVAGGIGVTAVRALLEDLPRASNPYVIIRASRDDDLVLREEIAELVRHRHGTLQELVGSREQVAVTAGLLRKLVPELLRREVFVCGPPEFVQSAVAAMEQAGVSRRHIHYEEFSW